MGVFGDGDNSKKGKKRGNPTSVSKLSALRDLANNRKRADWGDCSPEHMSGLVCEVTRRGGMVSFTRSRDEATLGIVIFFDGEKESFWFNDSVEVDTEIEKLIYAIVSVP